MNRIEKANQYIAVNKARVKLRPGYHFTPPVGWMNDPNGFCYFNNEYHLFYQYNPYDVVWSNIHWGHAVSDDLINWKHYPVVMANDRTYDISGCFSGSAIMKDDRLYLLYTGHIDPNLGFDSISEQIVQQQCLAEYKKDGTVEKFDSINPVIGSAELPQGFQVRDFRDPKVYMKHDIYYAVTAARNAENRGSILLYKSENLECWEFVSEIYRRPAEENTLFECPDLFTVNGKDILLLSLMPCEEKYRGIVRSEVEYVVGKMDYERGVFVEESRGLLDQGSSFYAPQSSESRDGSRVLIGWASNWSAQGNPRVEELGYNGIMTLPRQIEYKEGRIQQRPAAYIAEYEQIRNSVTDIKFSGKFIFEKGFVSQHINICIEEFVSSFNINLPGKEEKAFMFSFNSADNIFAVRSDYDKSVSRELEFDYAGKAEIDIYIDNHIIELYLNGVPFTYLCYDFEKGEGVTLNSISELRINRIVQYEISGVEIV